MERAAQAVSQSAIWDALLIAGDALQDGRLEDCEGVLAELDEMEAWSFIVQPRYGYMRGQSLVEWKVERVMAGDWIPPTPMDDCAAAVDLGIAAITAMRTAGRTESDCRRMVRWTAIAQQLLATVMFGPDAIEVRIRSWMNFTLPGWNVAATVS